MKKNIAVIISFCLLLLACSKNDLVVDATTKEAFQTSVQKITATLNGKQKEEFTKSIFILMLKASKENNGDEEKAFESLKSKLDGKTVNGVIKETPSLSDDEMKQLYTVS